MASRELIANRSGKRPVGCPRTLRRMLLQGQQVPTERRTARSRRAGPLKARARRGAAPDPAPRSGAA
jgi:hypothetical protein